MLGMTWAATLDAMLELAKRQPWLESDPDFTLACLALQ
jgi:hypothetical protein